MRFFREILAAAETAGLFDADEVIERLAALPAWLRELQTPAGIQALELLLTEPAPAAVMEFWSCPALVCLTDANEDLECLVCSPRVIDTDLGRCLRFAISSHDGAELAAQLGAGDDPPVFCVNHWGGPLAFRYAERFSEWLRDKVGNEPPAGPGMIPF